MSEYHKNFTGVLIDHAGTERHFIGGAYGRADDLPSVIWADGSQFWYKANPKSGIGQARSIMHRDGDLPAARKVAGSRDGKKLFDEFFYKEGKLHRDNGLAAVVLVNGTRKWFTHGSCTSYQIEGRVSNAAELVPVA